MKVITRKEKIITNDIDHETGELLDQNVEIKKHNVVLDSAEQMAYISSSILGLFDNLSGLEVKVVAYCALNAEFNTNLVNLTKPGCVIMEKRTGLKYQTIKNTISSLKKKNILIALGSGSYRVNPRYAWKGSKDDRKKTMKFMLDVECPDC